MFGVQIDVEVFSFGVEVKLEDIVVVGLVKVKEEGFDIFLVDIVGCFQIDIEMMEEMVWICIVVQFDEVLLVVDLMIGQEVVEFICVFYDQVGIIGVVFIKFDGDFCGGVVFLICKVSGQLIKFIGIGEKVEVLQLFYFEWMVSCIFGMGDVLMLVEKVQKEVEFVDVEKMQKKLQEVMFDFLDFVKQMCLIKCMGLLGGLMKMILGMNKIDDGMFKQGE